MRWKGSPGALALCLALLACPASAMHEPWATLRFPQDEDKWWWDADWWERGTLPVPANYAVRARAASYRNGAVEIPPAARGPHARR